MQRFFTDIQSESTKRHYFLDSNAYIGATSSGNLSIYALTLLTLGLDGDIGCFGSTLRAFKSNVDQKMDIGTTGSRIHDIFLGNDFDILDGGNFIIGTTTGSIFGQSSSLMGWWGATAVVRTAAFTQTYATASRTMPNLTSNAVSTTAATNVTPYGYTTQAQANAIVTAINALRTDVNNGKQVVNQILDDLQSYGLLQ